MPVILPADSLIRPGVVIKAEAVLKVANGGREWDSDTDMGVEIEEKHLLDPSFHLAAECHHFGILHRPSVSVEVITAYLHRHVGGISCQVPVSVLVSSGFCKPGKEVVLQLLVRGQIDYFCPSVVRGIEIVQQELLDIRLAREPTHKSVFLRHLKY